MTLIQLPIAERGPSESFFHVPSSPEGQYFDGELPIPEVEVELESRFSYERMTSLTQEYLCGVLGQDWREQVAGRRFVGTVPANGDFKDLGAFVETTRFASKFKRPASQIYEEYSAYDEDSHFAVVIDTSLDEPFPIGSLRMILPNTNTGFKTTHDFVGEQPTNPWREEVRSLHFRMFEDYDQETAWERVVASTGDNLELAETMDIPTLAELEDYASNGALDGVSLALYNRCLEFALANGMKNLISVQDLRPLAILQGYGDPFDTFPGVTPKVNEGEFPGIPAYCVIERGVTRIREKDAFVGAVFVDGYTLDKDYLLPQEYSKDKKIAQDLGHVASFSTVA